MKKIKYLIFLFLGLVLTGLMAPVWMPLVTEKIIFPFLAKSIHIVSITGLTRIHCEELVLSDLKMGLKEKSFLEVDSLKTLYSPDRLIKKQIKGIEIQGMRVNMEWTSGRFILPGFDFNALFSVSSKAQQEASLPWKIGSVKIEDSSFQIHMDGKTFKIPFEFFSQCSFPESDGKTCLIHSELKLKLEGFPMQAELSGQTCFANGNISSKGEFKLRIDSGSLGFFHLSCTEGFTCTLYYSAEFQSDGIRQCEIHSDTGQESLVKFQGPWGNIFSGLPSVSFTVVNNPVQGRGSLKGDLSIREITWNDLKGEGIGFHVSQKWPGESVPGETLTLDRLGSKGFEIRSGKMDFRMESFTSIFVEQSDFIFCDGHVNAYAFTLEGDKPIDFILHCDRLNLAELLQQMQVAQATGKGCVNGKVPIVWEKGGLTIRDGFLYTTPGEKGVFRLKENAILQNIEAAGGQAVTNEIAMEALKHFEYEWAKLSLNTQGENLELLLEMNGKSADPLPFGFDKKQGLYKLEGNKKGNEVHFQGFQFDLRFKVPLNKILLLNQRWKETTRQTPDHS